MTQQKNEYNLRIPQNISLIFCEKKRILTVNGPLKKKSLRLALKITVDKIKNIVSVSPSPFYKVSNAKKKQIEILRKTTLAQLKHLFIESSIIIFKKLKIVGVGFRSDYANTLLKKRVLTLKLGFSHPIYVKIPQNLHLDNLTKTKFCIYGNSYNEISKFAAIMRAKKRPEPYKGKGILYESETVFLKEGKKI